MFEIDGMRLLTEDGTVSFEKEIMIAIELEGVVIIRLIVDERDDGINNVFGIKGGKVIWRIQDASEYNHYFKIVDKYYAGIKIYEENPRFMIATTNRGVRFVIDPLTGRIIKQESAVR